MSSLHLTPLPSAWHVDQAILSEERRLVVLRFGECTTPAVLEMDELLGKIQDLIKNYATIYTVDNTVIKDFNGMYELYDECTVMFFFRNKHIQVDFGTGNNNKINFHIPCKQELIDICEVAYKAASKGKGLAISPKDYSTTWRY